MCTTPWRQWIKKIALGVNPLRSDKKVRALPDVYQWFYSVSPARSKLHRAQTDARLRVAPGTCVPAVAVRATEIPPIQPLYRGFPEVSYSD